MPIAAALLVVIGSLAGAPAAFAQYQGHNFGANYGFMAANTSCEGGTFWISLTLAQLRP